MQIREFNGHKVCNSLYTMMIYYPQITNGGDANKDLVKLNDNAMWAAYYYAAFRMGADPEARKMSLEELINELDYEMFLDPAKMLPLYELILDFVLGEGAADRTAAQAKAQAEKNQ